MVSDLSVSQIMFRTVLTVAASISISKATGLRGLEMAKSLPSTSIPKSMKAVGFYKHLDINDPKSLEDVEVDVPTIGNSEVLVRVKAIGMNPIDTKVRAPSSAKTELSALKILGWDGAGVVVEKGQNTKLFNVGDEVIFTGDLRKNGSNAQYVALDQVLVAPKPKTLDFEQAAAMPLTSVTAYEALYDRLGLTEDDSGKNLLIINSAGGVGSVAIQLAKHLGLRVIGTASRPETLAFSRKFGADLILNHTQNLLPQLEAEGIMEVDYILVNYDPYPYWDFLMQAIKPQGKICLIVDSSQPVDIRQLKDKSITLVSEMMNTRIKYDTPDKSRHNDILREISNMLDKGILKTTLSKVMSPISAQTLKEAHKIIESKQVVGKLVLTGF